MVFGAFGEISEEARTLLCYAADATAARTWVEDGATSQEHAAALLKNRLYRRWGIKTTREYARIKIDGLRLVGGNPDFTNAPGHGDRGIAIWESSDPKTRFDYRSIAITATAVQQP